MIQACIGKGCWPLRNVPWGTWHLQMTPAKSQQAMTGEGKMRGKSWRDDKHSRSLEGKNDSCLPDQCHSPTSISGNYLPWEAFTKRKKKMYWNLQSAYFWKPPSKIAWLSICHRWTSVLLDPCLLGVEGEMRELRPTLGSLWGHWGTQDEPSLDAWPHGQ